MGKVRAIGLGLLGLAAGCVGADADELGFRYGTDTDYGSSGGDGGGSDDWTSAGSWSTSAGSSSSTGDGWGTTGADTGGTDGTSGGSSGTGGATKIKLVMQDLEYARVEDDDDPWPVQDGVDVFPSVPGCIEVYQYTCEGFKKPPWPDECMISGEGGFLRDFYTDPECVPFQQPQQAIVSCDAYCGEGGGSCDMQQIECGIGVVQSAYCKCHAK